MVPIAARALLCASPDRSLKRRLTPAGWTGILIAILDPSIFRDRRCDVDRDHCASHLRAAIAGQNNGTCFESRGRHPYARDRASQCLGTRIRKFLCPAPTYLFESRGGFNEHTNHHPYPLGCTIEQLCLQPTYQ